MINGFLLRAILVLSFCVSYSCISMIGERTGQVLEAGYSGTRKMLQGDSYTARSKCPWTKTGMYIGFGGDLGLSAYILSFQFASAPHIIGGLFYLIGSMVKTQYPEIKECG